MIFTVFAAVAGDERELIVERTEEGRKAAAKDKGRTGGRKPTITPEQIEAVTKLSESMTVKDASKQIGIARQSYYRLRKYP